MRMSLLSAMSLSLFCLSLSAAEPPDKVTLHSPDTDWALDIDIPGFKVIQTDFSRGAMLMAENKALGVMISAFIWKAPSKGGAVECREEMLKKLRASPAMSDVKTHEAGAIAILEYSVAEFKGMKINQRHLNAYMAEGEHWVDVHLSKVYGDKPVDDTLPGLLKRVCIKRPYTPGAAEEFVLGCAYYQKNAPGPESWTD